MMQKITVHDMMIRNDDDDTMTKKFSCLVGMRKKNILSIDSSIDVRVYMQKEKRQYYVA